MRPVALAVVALVTLVAGCGSDDDPDAGSTTTSTTGSTTTTTGSTRPDDRDLPGERIETFPSEGADLAVVGVAADDVLNVRSGPGVDFEVVIELDPLATGVVASGHNRSLDEEGIWAEVSIGSVTGWAHTAFLAHLGAVDDITTELAATPADRLRAETMLDLVQLVAGPRAESEPDGPELALVVVDGPSTGDLAEVTVDIVGFPDDSGLGERLHIFAEPGPDGVTLRTVERTVLCRRGVDDGLCL